MIAIDAVAGTIEVELSEAELAERKASWQPRSHDFQSGAIWRYAPDRGLGRERRGDPPRWRRGDPLFRRHLTSGP